MRGAVSAEEAARAVDEVLAQLPNLRPGFDTISDIAGLEPLSPEALEHIRRANQSLIQLQPGRVVRVVGRSAQVAVQFEKLSKQLGYSALLAFDVQEAERLLDGLPDDVAL